MIRLLLADDHAVLRAGLHALLDRQDDIEVVAETGNASEIVVLAEAHRPDVIVLDVTMPGNEDLSALREICARLPHSRVVILTMHENEELLHEALRLGAAGFVLKKAAESELLTAIRAVARGEAFVDPAMTKLMIGRLRQDQQQTPPAHPPAGGGLTVRELEILKLVAEGHTNKEVASALFISVKTVETHKANIAGKLGLRSRVEWVRYARDHRLTGFR